MKDIIHWCNCNEGFLSAILSIIMIFISILTISMSYKIGKMPYKKSISIIPSLYKKKEKYIMDVIIINTGFATILIRNIQITNNNNLIIGMYSEDMPKKLYPNRSMRCKIIIYEDIANIERHAIDLNNHIKIIAVTAVDGLPE